MRSCPSLLREPLVDRTKGITVGLARRLPFLWESAAAAAMGPKRLCFSRALATMAGTGLGFQCSGHVVARSSASCRQARVLSIRA